MALYATLFLFLKPNLGRRRCNGIWPPSNPGLREYPERDWAPLCPRVDVPPLPDPSPRPMRFLLETDPLAGFKFDKFIMFPPLLYFFN